ncbi:MFS transporter [Methylosinus sp. H3A]|uniref:MFS transporter n=1 Tax=Methylosinus sp. H3A TaxID=2785786 RepID=UPI0018C322FE|nr:MFS transporter [Methylosinus sp. H3A]MBG0812449.1 MFS transporter [Methylosinus sp. H3A]
MPPNYLAPEPTTNLNSSRIDPEDAPLNRFHWRLTFYSGGGPFLDGYILSIIGVAMVQATPELGLSTSWQGLIGASALIGIFFGGFLGGWLTDKFGRQVLYTLDLILIIACSIAQFWVQSAFALFILRLLIGVAVGADYPIATALLAEFAPRRYRGPLLGGLIAIWFAGAAVAYVIGETLLHSGSDGWRWMLASAALPATMFVIMRHGTPESPRWLSQKGRHAEAIDVIRGVYGTDIKSYQIPSSREGEPSDVRALFRSGYGTRLFFVTAFWTCSIIPLFAVYAFGPMILESLGLGGAMANFGSAFITALFLVGCLVALLVVNKLGRRKLMLHSFLWSGVALLLLSISSGSLPFVVLCFFSAYALFIGGAQVLTWIYPNELFPTEIRGTAVGLASSLSRIGAAVGTYLAPFSVDALGIGATMLIAAIITLVGFAVSLRWAPETASLGLDQSATL